MPEGLTPGSMEARAQPHTLFPFGFAPRFFFALLIGLIWLVAAWRFPRLIVGMLLWDVLAVAAWLVDLVRLPAPAQLNVTRTWSSPLTLAQPASARLSIQNFGRLSVFVALVDEIPQELREEPPALGGAAFSTREPESLEYRVLPRERGNIAVGRVFLRYRSSVGLAERWATASLAQTVCVLPDLPQAGNQALYLIRSRQMEMQKRQHRQPGMGREFEALREYRQGDELRDISWTATARRHQPITRTYTAERSQTVWIVIDAGRLLRARVRDSSSPFAQSKLDHAVNAALSLSQIASQHGDRVGLLAYGRSIQQSLAPGRGPQHLRRVVETLAHVRTESVEADHARAARTLLQKQTRRSLVVWITDFAETPVTPDVIQYAAQLAKRNLVLFAAISQPDLAVIARAAVQSETEMFRQTAALEIVSRRDLLLRNLRQTGVLALDLVPGGVTASIVNEYLRIKDRNML